MLQCVAVCCSVLQCVAVCCSVLQCVAVCCSVLQCAAVCCSVLQCVAVCRSVFSEEINFSECVTPHYAHVPMRHDSSLYLLSHCSKISVFADNDCSTTGYYRKSATLWNERVAEPARLHCNKGNIVRCNVWCRVWCWAWCRVWCSVWCSVWCRV